MSYNTRRTGGAGRGQTTQVNYHQQSRPGATVTQQSRNPGYTTTSTNYNSASQPVYSTQQPASYNTTPPQPQQAQAPAAPPTQPPPPSTPAPILKQEPVTPAPTPTKTETPASENGTGTGTGTQPNRPVWKKTPFAKLSNRVKKARRNAKLRRALNPKNAITFLNELRPGDVKFTVREEAGWGFIASVDIDGKIYNGHALSVSKAKAQASEVALKHILMEQMAKSAAAAAAADDKPETKQEPDEEMDTEEKEGEGEEPKAKRRKAEEDELPWGSLAAFALHKLFEHWHKEGGAGGDGPMPPSQFRYEEEMTDDESYYRKPGPEFGYPRRPPPGAPMFSRGRGFGPYPPRGFVGPRRLPPPPASTFLGNSRQPINIGNAPFPNNLLPMKKIPEDANKKNPVMLLNQLKPNVVYDEFQEGTAPNVVFRITVNLDGQEFVGRGKSKKDAKRMAAKAALAPLGVVYDDDKQ